MRGDSGNIHYPLANCPCHTPPDVIVTNKGTLWILEAKTATAKEWIEENVSVPDYMTVGPNTFAADWRQGRDIVRGMVNEGLEPELHGVSPFAVPELSHFILDQNKQTA